MTTTPSSTTNRSRRALRGLLADDPVDRRHRSGDGRPQGRVVLVLLRRRDLLFRGAHGGLLLGELFRLGRLLLDRDARNGRVVLQLRRRQLGLRVLDVLAVLEFTARLVLLGAREPLLRGGLLALCLRQAGLGRV